MNDAICLDCGYKSDINDFNVNSADEGDPNPTIECPKCGGCGEYYAEGILAFLTKPSKDKKYYTNDLSLRDIDFVINKFKFNP